MSQKTPLPKLLKGEKIVFIKEIKDPAHFRSPSSLRELERLSLAKNTYEVGKFGPVLASEPMGGHRDEPAFRRYEALFGRDSLRVALDVLDSYPKLVRATLIRLAELQGVESNDSREEEPGKIIHEARDPQFDPIARELSLERGWGWPYYGSVDSTPEFIRTLYAYCLSQPDRIDFLERHYIGKDGKQHKMSDALIAAVNWLIAKLESNKEGILEFKRLNPNGIENQAWKDSWDSYFHSNGVIANHDHGIASIEIQRVVHDALIDAAHLYEKYLNKKKDVSKILALADNLKKRIMATFWTDADGGYFVLGTDRDDSGKIRQLKIKTSNMGHMLHSNLLNNDDPEITRKREALIKQLFSPELLGISGIMTLANNEVRYRPGAYHNGSVWGWDNYFLAQGLRQNGYIKLANFLEHRLLAGIEYSKRYIEYLRGGNDKQFRINNQIVDVWDEVNKRVNRVEQPPQDMQAWTAAAVLAISIRNKTQKKESNITIDKAKAKFEKSILESIKKDGR